jgi:SAM-dependent methyltransferase
MSKDTFKYIAGYYDSMMSHIDYERWLIVATMIAELCPDENFEHLDVGSGTGELVKRLREYGWRSYGIDLSHAMLSTSRKSGEKIPVAQANMTNLPFNDSFHFLTCVFDSLNFLLDPSDFVGAFQSMRASMTDDGIVYFDVITERMVLDHYADREWVDTNGKSEMRWSGVYDGNSRIIENTIRVDGGAKSVVRERVYTIAEIHEALENAGLTILGIVDTETWCAPTDETLRLDIVASVRDSKEMERSYRYIQQDIQILLAEED